MRTRSLYKGDRLIVLKDKPCGAALEIGDVVEIVGFMINGSPIVSNALNRKPLCPSVKDWLCNLRQIFHHYKKETK